MGEIRSRTSNPSSRSRLIQGSPIPSSPAVLNDHTSIQTSPTLEYGGHKTDPDQWNIVRISVWSLASDLYILEDLQHFAETVTPTNPLDIRKTAQILARAQLELRELMNERSKLKYGKGQAVTSKILNMFLGMNKLNRGVPVP